MAFVKSQYDVVLVYPPPEAVVEEHDQPENPNISIAYIGGYLEKHGEVTPALIDARLSRYTLNTTVEKIIALKPKIVGITAFTHAMPMAASLSEKLKNINPDIKTVLGGFHSTFLPERTLKEFPVFDYLVVGEGEIAFTKLVNGLLSGQSCEAIPGVWLQKNGEIIDNKRGEITKSLDETGEPGWHLFDQDILKKYCRVLPVITQRGCPFNCNFCSRPYGHKVRKRSNAFVVDEIQKNIKNYHIRKIDFYDETFSANKKETKALCEEILRRGIEIAWTCTTHVNTIDKELVHLMKSAGCTDARFGVESGNSDIIKQMHKGITKKRIIEVHKLFKEAGVPTTAFFILGHPNETVQSLMDTIKFAIRLNADKTSIGIMVPYPGTKVWEMANHGSGGYKKLSPEWRDYNKQLGNAVELEKISRRQLELAQIMGYISIYVFNFRIRDLIKMFKENYNLAMGIITKIIKPRSLP